MSKDALLAHWQTQCDQVALTCTKCTCRTSRSEISSHDCIQSLLKEREKDKAEIKRLKEREEDFMLNLMPKLLQEYVFKTEGE